MSAILRILLPVAWKGHHSIVALSCIMTVNGTNEERPVHHSSLGPQYLIRPRPSQKSMRFCQQSFWTRSQSPWRISPQDTRTFANGMKDWLWSCNRKGTVSTLTWRKLKTDTMRNVRRLKLQGSKLRRAMMELRWVLNEVVSWKLSFSYTMQGKAEKAKQQEILDMNNVKVNLTSMKWISLGY